MSLPQPAHQLDDSCSVIHNKTLYSFTSTAFQAISLEKGSQWVELPMGVAVKGGVCVKTTPVDDSASTALYIVGGMANSSDYQGLQRFIFEKGIWETITPTDPVTHNRMFHGSMYLAASNSILVYSGTQDGIKEFSTQTFTIQTSEPFQVSAYESMAPPAVYPILLPWSDNRALYIGGTTENQNLMLFDPVTSWINSNVSLANPIGNPEAIKAAIITGDDSSKNLYTFDTTVSPNKVDRIILVDADGNPIQSAVPTSSGGSKASSGGDIKSLTLDTWPPYDDSLSPSAIRTSPAISQDSSGLVIISGGSETNPLCVFQVRQNSWIDPKQVFGTSTRVDSNVLSLNSATGTPVPKTTSDAANSSENSNVPLSTPFPVKLLVAALGSIIAAALLIITVIIVCRKRRKRRNGNGGSSYDKNDGMDFRDKDVPSMISQKPSPNGVPKKGGRKANRLSHQSYKSAISKPIIIDHLAPLTEKADVSFEKPGPVPPRGDQKSGRRSSGWNRYWSGGSKANVAAVGLDNVKSGSARSSDCSEESFHKSIGSPPDRPDIYNVRLGSPTVAYQPQHLPSRGEISGKRSSGASNGSGLSYNEDRNGNYSNSASRYNQDQWTPLEKQNYQSNYPGSKDYGATSALRFTPAT